MTWVDTQQSRGEKSLDANWQRCAHYSRTSDWKGKIAHKQHTHRKAEEAFHLWEKNWRGWRKGYVL